MRKRLSETAVEECRPRYDSGQAESTVDVVRLLCLAEGRSGGAENPMRL